MSGASRAWLLTVAFAALTAADAWAAAAQPAAEAADALPGGNSGAPQEVTVTGRRLPLAKRVRKFVDQVAVLENSEGVALWKRPVCPLVTGFPLQEGGAILKRLAEAARAAHVPLGADECYPPNLFIVETADPKGLLQGWSDRGSTRRSVFNGATDDLFAGASQSVIKEFIDTPRAVRVWYYTHREDASGLAISPETSLRDPPQLYEYEASRIESHNVVYDFFRVFVIVDEKRLQGVTPAQLADYVSMVALAKLKPDAHLADAPTVLRLFEGPPRNAPSGMTAWDRALLASLYAADQGSRLQRSQIARVMVRDIAH